jgi:hypothetical protein
MVGNSLIPVGIKFSQNEIILWFKIGPVRTRLQLDNRILRTYILQIIRMFYNNF